MSSFKKSAAFQGISLLVGAILFEGSAAVAQVPSPSDPVPSTLCEDPVDASYLGVRQERFDVIAEMNRFDLRLSNCLALDSESIQCNFVLINRKSRPVTFSLNPDFWRTSLFDNFGDEDILSYAYFTNGHCERVKQQEINLAQDQGIVMSFVYSGRTDRVRQANVSFNLNLMYGDRFQLRAPVAGIH